MSAKMKSSIGVGFGYDFSAGIKNVAVSVAHTLAPRRSFGEVQDHVVAAHKIDAVLDGAGGVVGPHFHEMPQQALRRDGIEVGCKDGRAPFRARMRAGSMCPPSAQMMTPNFTPWCSQTGSPALAVEFLARRHIAVGSKEMPLVDDRRSVVDHPANIRIHHR